MTKSLEDPAYYSQHGEDYLLSKLFDGRNNGVFIEIGCIDGRRFSNTLRFEQLGWTGLCVEAHADYIDMLRKNRPGSIVEHAAVGEKDVDMVDFYANSRGSLSSLDKTKEKEFEKYKEYFTGFDVQNVPMRTLNTIFKKHGITKIDLLSLDIEGYEVQALKGLNLKVYRPQVFVIEYDSADQKQQIDDLLLPVGYFAAASLKQNLFYSLDSSHLEFLRDQTFSKIPVVHTRHPLDTGGDTSKVIDVTVGTAQPICDGRGKSGKSTALLKDLLGKFRSR